VADPPERVPIGPAVVRREGTDLVMMTVGVGVHRCLASAETLAGEGISAAVMDLRTVSPLDTSSVVRSARATGRVLVVDEDYTRGGLSGEIAARLGEAGVAAAYARVTTGETIPYARALEAEVLPNVPRILAAARCLMDRRIGG
jgi:pyruvate/2-oxoglutarate/acetoin dehydrogenase E1 component